MTNSATELQQEYSTLERQGWEPDPAISMASALAAPHLLGGHLLLGRIGCCCITIWGWVIIIGCGCCMWGWAIFTIWGCCIYDGSFLARGLLHMTRSDTSRCMMFPRWRHRQSEPAKRRSKKEGAKTYKKLPSRSDTITWTGRHNI